MNKRAEFFSLAIVFSLRVCCSITDHNGSLLTVVALSGRF